MQKTLLLIDVQEKLLPAVDSSAELLNTLCKVLKTHQLLQLPLFVTEQYPKGLGPTVEVLSDILDDSQPISKTSFSCFGGQLEQDLMTAEKTELILVGIETHVCVYQTCLDALSKGYRVTVLVDGVSSRSTLDKDVALRNLEKKGAHLSTFECEYMGILKDAKHPRFKEFSKILKD